MKTCGARTKHDGTPCARSPVRGRTRCRLHGGKTLVGPASPHFRTGRYSAYLPERLRARYEQAEGDAELLNLRGEIALIDARLVDLLSRVDTGESGQLWADLRRAHQEFKVAKRGEDVARMHTALARMEHLIDSAVQDHVAWAEIGALIEQRRKLTESEAKRLVTLQQMLTAAEAMAIVHRLVDIVTRHVPDRQALSAIVVELQALAGQPQGVPVYQEAPDTDDA
jgi:hypothetical protein